MSNHHTDRAAKISHHGSASSYVVGFVLSLVFTLIPYYLVTRGIMSGSAMLLTILGLAVLQMFVQVFFFLHLGRGPKPLYNVVFFFATAGIIVLVVGASLIIMNNLYRSMSPQEVTTRLAQEENISQVGGKQTGACQGNNANHVITINDGQVSPLYTKARRCDTLTFTIKDNKDREFVFGPENDRSSYGGLQVIPVRSTRSEIITLNEIGDFNFSDPSDQRLTGRFTVKP